MRLSGSQLWFATQLLDCLRVGGVLAEEVDRAASGPATNAGAAPADAKAATVTSGVLERHARVRWEALLGVVLKPPAKQYKLAMPCEVMQVGFTQPEPNSPPLGPPHAKK